VKSDFLARFSENPKMTQKFFAQPNSDVAQLVQHVRKVTTGGDRHSGEPLVLQGSLSQTLNILSCRTNRSGRLDSASHFDDRLQECHWLVAGRLKTC
jgi:hypothetical protein